jgi:hypothetical protein
LEERYFEMLAGVGITKHMGSMNSTEALIEACHRDYVEGIWWMLRMYVTDPATRGFLKQA